VRHCSRAKPPAMGPMQCTAADIDATISSMAPEDGLMVAADQFLWANRRLIVDLAARYRVPTIYAWSGYVDQGGLMAYTVDSKPGVA
jgi:putative ABC transport system substrate-binding protein